MRRGVGRIEVWAWAVVSAGCFLSAAALEAQTGSRQDLPALGSGKQALAFPVSVTDKAGDPVTGLAVTEFEIEDQGKKVAPVLFFPVAVGESIPDQAGTLARAAVRRQFLFLFDLVFSTPTAIAKSQEVVRAWVGENLAATDLVAVATNDASGIRFLVGFTSDRLQIGRAIDTLGLKGTERPRDHLGLAFDLSPASSATASPTASEEGNPALPLLRAHFDGMGRVDRSQYGRLAGSFVGGLQNLAQMLESVQGRKYVILLSGGFDPSIRDAARGPAAEDADDEGDNPLNQVEFGVDSGGPRPEFARIDRIAAHFALSDAAVHSVDVMEWASGGAGEETLPVRIGQGREVLSRLARGSGGRLVKSPGSLSSELNDLLKASRSFYVIGFEPADAGKKDGPRKLRVRVKRDGVEVAHRRGYTLPDLSRPADPVTRRMQAAEVIGKGIAGGTIGLRVLAMPYRGAGGALALPVIVEVDGRWLLEGKAEKPRRLEVYVYAFDAAGRILDSLGFTPSLDLSTIKGHLEKKGLQLLTSLSVAKGPIDLRVLVRDGESNRAGSFVARLEVPSFEADRMVLSPPLVMDDPRGRLVIPAASPGNPRFEIPFRLVDKPFTAEALPTLRNGVPREMCLLVWTGAPIFAASSSLGVVAELVDPSGRAHALTYAGAPRIVSDADGLQRFVVNLALKDVPPGPYALRVSLTDPTRGPVARSETSVEVN